MVEVGFIEKDAGGDYVPSQRQSLDPSQVSSL